MATTRSHTSGWGFQVQGFAVAKLTGRTTAGTDLESTLATRRSRPGSQTWSALGPELEHGKGDQVHRGGKHQTGDKETGEHPAVET